MKCALSGFLLLISTIAQAQSENWKPLRVDKHLTVQLPASSKEMDLPGTMAAANAPNQHDPQVQASRAFRGEDKVANYILVVIPFSGETHVPKDAVARASYYKNRLAPMLMAKARGELLTQAVTVKKGVDVLTIKYRVLNSTGLPVVKYMQSFTIGGRIYELFFTPKDGTGQNCALQRIRFLSAIVITQ
jgi:hypothetical protein